MKKISVYLSLVALLALFVTTMAYSSLNVTLDVKGEANVRPSYDIRITGVRITEIKNAEELYNPRFSKNTISTGFNLNSNDSFITYEVTIRNEGNTPMMVSNLLESLDNNESIAYELNNYQLYDILDSNKDTKIKVTYHGLGKKESTLEFQFMNYYHTITYNALDGHYNDESNINRVKYHFDGTKNILIDGVVYMPNKDSTTFSNWYTNPNYLTIFNETSLHTTDIEVYAKYEEIEPE